MATTVHIPISLNIPQSSANKGNSWYGVEALTDLDQGAWYFRRDVDGKVFGQVYVPQNLNATPAAAIKLIISANATSGVTRLNVATKAVADAESLNPTLTDETAQDITVPATARLRKDVRFPTSGNIGETVAAGDLLLVEIYHAGAHANDTLAAETILHEALLICDI